MSHDRPSLLAQFDMRSIRSPSAVTEALTMPWTFADAIIDEEASGDNGAEAAMLAHEQASKTLGMPEAQAQAPPVKG